MNMEHSGIPKLPCMCGSLRRTSRALTQLYETALRPLGLRATQFTILQALSLAGGVTQSELGEMLALDSTTLTRTLGLMSRQGWIAERRGQDRRAAPGAPAGGAACRAGFRRLFGTIQTSHCESGSFRERAKLGREPRERAPAPDRRP